MASHPRLQDEAVSAAWLELGRDNRGDTICCASSSGSHGSRQRQQETFVSTQLAILSARSLLMLWAWSVCGMLSTAQAVAGLCPAPDVGQCRLQLTARSSPVPRPAPGPGMEPVIRLTPVVITLHCHYSLLPPAQHDPSPYPEIFVTFLTTLNYKDLYMTLYAILYL